MTYAVQRANQVQCSKLCIEQFSKFRIRMDNPCKGRHVYRCSFFASDATAIDGDPSHKNWQQVKPFTRCPLLVIFNRCLSVSLQIPVELVEYSVNAVSEGIDSVATTRVVIRSENEAGSSQIHSQTGAEVHRSFR